MISVNNVCVCSRCGTRLVKQEIVDSKMISRFEPVWVERTIQNDDGSYTRIILCKTCDNK
jgi:hypothetical protein